MVENGWGGNSQEYWHDAIEAKRVVLTWNVQGIRNQETDKLQWYWYPTKPATPRDKGDKADLKSILGPRKTMLEASDMSFPSSCLSEVVC